MRVAYRPPRDEPAVSSACRKRNEERYWLIAGASFGAFPEWFGEKMSYKLQLWEFSDCRRVTIGTVRNHRADHWLRFTDMQQAESTVQTPTHLP